MRWASLKYVARSIRSATHSSARDGANTAAIDSHQVEGSADSHLRLIRLLIRAGKGGRELLRLR